MARADPASGNPISSTSFPLFSARSRLGDLALALSAASSAKLRAALADYAGASAAAVPATDAYARGNRMLNLLIKDNLLKRAAREAELVARGADFEGLRTDAEIRTLSTEGAELDFYVNGQYYGLYDERNFPEFPSGGEYLGSRQYFAMGDNRYNSLDFRYKTGNVSPKSLDPADPSSVRYDSNIEPFALDLQFIEGYALFRIWPPSRVGAIK